MKLKRMADRLAKALRPASRAADISMPENGGKPLKVPKHVAIIMDGNGRWAKQKGMNRSAGHVAGTEALREIIRASDDWGIEALTIYAFSTENWVRPQDEVSTLMGLILRYFQSEIDELDAKGVRVRILGDIQGLPQEQHDAVTDAMRRTAANTGLKLNIALNYGGRAEIANGVRSIARKVQSGEVKAEDIDEAMIASSLYTRGLPEVDLLIRTSGEVRLSNFLLWQVAYAEMVFDDVLWPDFTRERYLHDLNIYASRDRRFGGVK